MESVYKELLKDSLIIELKKELDFYKEKYEKLKVWESLSDEIGVEQTKSCFVTIRDAYSTIFNSCKDQKVSDEIMDNIISEVENELFNSEELNWFNSIET